MRKHPKISLLVPACNEEAVIEDTLKELINEVKYPNKEIIVGVDDGNDRTLEIAKSFARKYKGEIPVPPPITITFFINFLNPK